MGRGSVVVELSPFLSFPFFCPSFLLYTIRSWSTCFSISVYSFLCFISRLIYTISIVSYSSLLSASSLSGSTSNPRFNSRRSLFFALVNSTRSFLRSSLYLPSFFLISFHLSRLTYMSNASSVFSSLDETERRSRLCARFTISCMQCFHLERGRNKFGRRDGLKQINMQPYRFRANQKLRRRVSSTSLSLSLPPKEPVT